VDSKWLNCVLVNARSICNKLVEFRQLIYSNDYDVIFICESWLTSNWPNGILDPLHMFNIVRCDRNLRSGGGVCILIKKSLNYAEIAVDDQFNLLEICCIDIILGTHLHYRFVCTYRPPGNNRENMEYASLLAKYIDVISSSRHPIVMLGDLNLPNIDWLHLAAQNDGIHNFLLDTFVSNGFTQLVTDPTRGDNILDIILTNEPTIISKLSVCEPFSNSDHNQVQFCVDVISEHSEVTNSYYTEKRFLWHEADYDGMNLYLSAVDWYGMLTVNLSPNDLWSALRDKIYEAANLFVPITNYLSNVPKRGHLKLYPKTIRNGLARKRCLWRAHRKDPENSRLFVRYKKCETECRNMIQKHELAKEAKVISADNIGSFYKFVNNRLTCSTGIATLLDNAGNAVTSDADKAELLNQYFGSVCTKDDGQLPCLKQIVPKDAKLSSVDFSINAVLRVLKKLKTKSAPGPDKLPSVLYKNLSYSLAEPLSLLFASCQSVGKIPDEWRSAIVTPLYKGGISSAASNYRPVSLTCVVCKIMERIITSETLSYLRAHDVISKQQHGFLSRRCTETNLLECLNDWTLALHDRKSVMAVYVDFAKAFDSVSHKKLCHKLLSYGIDGNLYSLLENFLADRSQCTRVGNSYSTQINLCSGVIQGSCLGPLLFILYINDIVQLFDGLCVCKLYADDLKLYSIVESPTDHQTMQYALNRLFKWADTWQLNISYKKCSALPVGSLSLDYVFTFGSNTVSNVSCVRDLGVLIDSNLSFAEHISHIVAKAHARACLIHKCFLSRDTSTLVRAFITYVRPLLEYCSCVWSPHLKNSIYKIESVQRKFTKRLRGLSKLSYSDRLEALNLPSLELRRLRIDLTWCYKILFGVVDVPVDDFFAFSPVKHTRGHSFKLFKRRSNTCARSSFFSVRVVNAWNSLPYDTNFNSVAGFKRSIAKADFSEFLNVDFMSS